MQFCEKCPDEKYQNLEGQASCKSCPENSVSNPDVIGCTCNEGFVFENEKCIPCSEKFPGCKLCSEKGCSECNSEDLTIIGDGLACGRPPKSQEDCAPYNSVYVPYVKQGKYDYSTGKYETDFEDYGFCMTKYNAGDLSGPSIYTNKIKVVYNADNIDDYYNSNTCWKPKSDENYNKLNGCDKKEDLNKPAYNSYHGYGSNNNSPLVERNSKYKEYDYSGCERTVCGENAAWFICNAHNIDDTKAGYWALPTDRQLRNLSSIFAIETKEKPIVNNFMGGDGLQLCAVNETQLCCRKIPGYTAWTDVGEPKHPELNGTIACLHGSMNCEISIYYDYPYYSSLNEFSKTSLVTFDPSEELHFYNNSDGSKSVYGGTFDFDSRNYFEVNKIEFGWGSMVNSPASVRCVLNYVPVK